MLTAVKVRTEGSELRCQESSL